MTTAKPRATRHRGAPLRFARALPATRLTLLALVLAQGGVAAASPGTSTEFRPSPSAHDGSGGLQLVHPFTGGKGSAYLGGNYADVLPGKTDEALMASIKNGKTGAIGTMPPWGGTLNDEQIKAVLGYVKTTFGPKG